MLRVVVDTNFLILPFANKVDIFSEIERLVPEKHEIVTLSSVLEELKGLGIKGKAPLQLAKSKNLRVIEAKEKVDESLVKIGKEPETIVCTNDFILRKRLRTQGTPTIFLRSSSHLERLP
jgi:rRNA-processing protein FCF1